VELSLVVPAYNERDNLAPLLAEIAAALAGPPPPRPLQSYEVIVVDDGSTDGTLETLKALRRQYPELRIISFERNAGQTAAFAAGFRAARAPIVVTLDADLQNDPADIPRLIETLQRTGATAVAGYRATRRDTAWKRLQSRIANGVRNRLNGEVIRDTGCSLKAFRTDAVRALPLFAGMHRFLPTLIKMQGGTVTEIAVGHRPRKHGVTKYGMWNRVLRSLIDAFVVRWMQGRVLRYRVREEA
jgi:glycosyltransferase involved in cell wall biosynthesis